MDALTILQKMDEAANCLPSLEMAMGKAATMPGRELVSGARALMAGSQAEQSITLFDAEVPVLMTGNESKYGELSTSFISTNTNLKVIAKINKFSAKPNHHYYLIVYDSDLNIYDYIERTMYNHNTEKFGFLWNNDFIDSLNVGSEIPRGSVIKTSTGFDEFKNKMNGVNLVTMYVASSQTMEDSVQISDEAQKKLASPEIQKTAISINDNDILINKYGKDNTYKTFPDIGEHTIDGTFCGIRRVENNSILYTLSKERLRQPMISDRNIFMEGVVVDIDIYCNNPESLQLYEYNSQLYYYYQEKMRFYKEFNDIIAPIAMNNKLTRRLQRMYSTCRDALAGNLFYKDGQFNNIVAEVTTIKRAIANKGDKVADRYGGKGVISDIVPSHLMPMLENGRRIEIIKNQSTCINRENMTQLFEQSLSFIGNKLIEFFRTKTLPAKEFCNMWYDFMVEIDPQYANEIKEEINFDDPLRAGLFIDCILDTDRILITTKAYGGNLSIDTMERIYDKFPWIKPYKVVVPIEDSNGNIRYVEACRPLYVGEIYHYKLKQQSDDKFSVVDIPAIDGRGLNTRKRDNKIYEAMHTGTPIMFGAMEAGNMLHIGVDETIKLLLIYSASPDARKNFEVLYIGNPYDIDIRLDRQSKNRNAEIINAMLETKGLRLRIEKRPKEKKEMCRKIMCKIVPPSENKVDMNLIKKSGLYNMHIESAYNATIKQKDNNPMVRKIMCRKIGEENDQIKN